MAERVTTFLEEVLGINGVRVLSPQSVNHATLPHRHQRVTPIMEAASRMPPLPHFQKDGSFSIMKSKAVDWLISQPAIRQELWNWCKRNSVIVFDVDTRRWHGSQWSP